MARKEDHVAGQLTVAGSDDKGTPLKQIREYSATITPGASATVTAAEQTFTFTGLTTADRVLSVTPPSLTAGLGIANARVTAANTLGLTFVNPTAGSLTAPAGVYKVLVARI